MSAESLNKSGRRNVTRREFLRAGAILAGTAPLLLSSSFSQPGGGKDSRVAMAACKSYGPEVYRAMTECFDLLGGIGWLVKDKTVTVKINLTSTDFRPLFDRPPGETYVSHFATGMALATLLFKAGARRVRLVESTNSRSGLETSLGYADWDVKALEALGRVEFENTRNLGKESHYATLRVPDGGRLFSRFELNHSYADTDVMVSLCKLKQHVTAGVTLSMKNLFGITPNSLYGEEAGSEDATKGRGNLHSPVSFKQPTLPGLKADVKTTEAETRVPRIVTDLCAARPIHLAIIDGITSMSGGEGWWCGDVGKLEFVQPGVLIAGFNPVSTDAVGTAVMGYDSPRAPRGQGAFTFCDNMLLLAEEAGLGTADLKQIDVRGLSIPQARHPYRRIRVPAI